MEQINDVIYRICIPFEYIYTTVFIIVHGNDAIVLDSGSNDNDVNTYITPEIYRLGVVPKYLILSHNHGDHAGGMDTLQKIYPEAELITNLNTSKVLYERFKIISLPGHSDDSIAVLDMDTRMLLTGDCLQMYGIGHWGGNFKNYRQCLDSINHVRELSVNTIVAAHDFIPYGYKAEGEYEVKRFLDTCEKAIQETVAFVTYNKNLSTSELIKKFKKNYPDLPSICKDTITYIHKVGEKAIG